jgi:hypothetical protein
LHNLVANGSSLFLDLVGIPRWRDDVPTRDLGELIHEDKSAVLHVTDGSLVEQLNASLARYVETEHRRNVFVLGEERQAAATVIAALQRLCTVAVREAQEKRERATEQASDMQTQLASMRRLMRAEVFRGVKCYTVSEQLSRSFFVERVPQVLGFDRCVLPHQILEHLFLGDYVSAAGSLSLLRSLNITHVVNASNGLGRNVFSPHITYLNVDVDDSESAELSVHFDPVTKVILIFAFGVHLLILSKSLWTKPRTTEAGRWWRALREFRVLRRWCSRI